MKTRTRLTGHYVLEHIRDGKVLHREEGHNGICNGGLDDLLDVNFDGGSQNANWYIGLVDNDGFTAFAAADTMVSHAGWSELVGTDVDETAREEWAPGEPSSQSITNPAVVEYNVAATCVIKGIFVTSGSVFAATTGILWATAAFGSNISAVDDDKVRITYTVTAAEA